jgi:hypothetical protein
VYGPEVRGMETSSDNFTSPDGFLNENWSIEGMQHKFFNS